MSKSLPKGPRNFWGKVDVDHRQRARSKALIVCETLEGRALLTTGVPSNPFAAYSAAVTQLQTDLQTINASSQVTVSELTALSDALKQDASDATTHPTAVSLSTLKTDLLTAGSTGTLTTSTLITDETAILTSAGVPTLDITATTNAQSAIFTSSNVTGADLKTLNTDLTAIQNATPTRGHGGFGGPGQGGSSSGGFGGGIVGQTTNVLSSVLSIPIGSLSSLRPAPSTSIGTGGGTGTPNPVQVAETKLQTDLHTLDTKSQVTVAELTTLSTAVEKAQKDATSKPTAATLTALQTEITTEAQNSTLTPATIEADIAAVLTSAGVPTADSTAVTQAVDAIITSSRITGADLNLIYTDQQALKAAIAANPPTPHFGRGR